MIPVLNVLQFKKAICCHFNHRLHTSYCKFVLHASLFHHVTESATVLTKIRQLQWARGEFWPQKGGD